MRPRAASDAEYRRRPAQLTGHLRAAEQNARARARPPRTASRRPPRRARPSGPSPPSFRGARTPLRESSRRQKGCTDAKKRCTETGPVHRFFRWHDARGVVPARWWGGVATPRAQTTRRRRLKPATRPRTDPAAATTRMPGRRIRTGTGGGG